MNETPSNEPSKSKFAIWAPIVISLAALIGGGVGWTVERYLQRERQQEERMEVAKKEGQRLNNEYLVKIQVALAKTKAISDELTSQYVEYPWGILESYVAKATRDGHDKHALMYQSISSLIRYNTEIILLLDSYEPHILTEPFRSQAAELRHHAQRYIDRFEALPKVVVTKQQLPEAKRFPAEFPAALKAEIQARASQESLIKSTDPSLKRYCVNSREAFR